MSRVDDQRMQEMNEAKLRQKKDTEKRLNDKRLDKSFKQVMTERGRRKQAQNTARQHLAGTQAKEKQDEGQRVLQRIAQRPGPSAKEHSRRAALASAKSKRAKPKAVPSPRSTPTSSADSNKTLEAEIRASRTRRRPYKARVARVGPLRICRLKLSNSWSRRSTRR